MRGETGIGETGRVRDRLEKCRCRRDREEEEDRETG